MGSFKEWKVLAKGRIFDVVGTKEAFVA